MIKQNIENILKLIDNTAVKVGRKKEEIKLIAVSKTFPAEKVKEAIDAGIIDFGENYVQDFLSKYDKLFNEKINWHFIGHLQTNKIKYIFNKIALLHTLDSLKLAEKLNNKLSKDSLTLDVLVQVNIGKEENKYGIFEENLEPFFERLQKYKHIKIKGLMTITPYFENKEDVRPLYKKMKKLIEKLSHFNNNENINLKELSMGMSHDFDIAIEEGATMIRVGTSIFGQRKRRI